MEVNYSEYNQVHHPRAEHLYCFIKGLNHAMQKTNDYEGAMHQLRCIGYSEEFIQDMVTISHDYKEYHKQRIRTEHEAKQPIGLEVMYPTIKTERLAQYAENLRLIERIQNHGNGDEILYELEDVLNTEISVHITTFLDAYVRRDVDAMVEAITGWDLEALFVRANIIPDAKGFFPSRDVRMDEIAFPLYGKETLTVEEFKTYLLNVYNLHDDTLRLVQSVIRFAQLSCDDAAKRNDLLWAVLKEYDVPEEVVRMVSL